MLHTEVEVPSFPMRTFQFFTGILLLWNNILLLEWHLGNGFQNFGDRNGLFVFIDIHKLHYIYAYFLYWFHKSFSVILIISQCIYILVVYFVYLSKFSLVCLSILAESNLVRWPYTFKRNNKQCNHLSLSEYLLDETQPCYVIQEIRIILTKAFS